MNVGVLTASISRLAGGLFESVRRSAQELQRSLPVEVRIFGLEDSFTRDDLKEWDTLSVQAFPVKGPKAFGYAPDLSAALRAASLDLLQVEGIWMYPSLACLAWAKATGMSYLVRPHGMLNPWAVRNSRWKKRLAGWFYENAHLHRAACLLALCESEARSIRSYGLRNPVAVIPNGIDLPQLRSVPKNHTEGNPLRLLYLGRIHPQKGLSDLLRAWGALRMENIVQDGTWELTIAGWGQGGHEGALKAICRQAGIETSVRFLGPRFGAEKDAVYRAADAFILPSISEGVPMVVLEAWAYALPVIMTTQCNIPEGFEAGAAISIGAEVQSIVRGLTTFFAMSSSERTGMGLKGRSLVEQRFTWPKVAESLHAVHRWVLGGGSRPECVVVD